MAIPNDGAAYILNLVKSNTANLYIGLSTASPTDASTLSSGLNEVTATTGSYARKAVAAANWTITADTLSVAAGALPVEWTGMTNTTPITHAFIATSSDNSGKLLCYTALTTGNRTLSNLADKLDLSAVTFQLT